MKIRTSPCGLLSGILIAALLLLVCPAHAAFEPDFWGPDCNCSIGGIPPVTDSSAWIDDTHTYFYGVFCDYGRYGNEEEADRKAAHVQIKWLSPDEIAKKNAEKQKTVLNYLEAINTGGSPGSHLIEYIPPRPDYISLLYKKPAVSKRSTTYYSGERAIIYESRYYIEIYGIGYDISDAELKSLMDASESCAKAVIEKQKSRVARDAQEETQATPGFDTGVTVLACAVGTAVLVTRRW